MRKRTNIPPATAGSQTKVAVSMTELTAITVIPCIDHTTISGMMTALTGMKETVIKEFEITILTVTENAMMAAKGTAGMTITDKC